MPYSGENNGVEEYGSTKDGESARRVPGNGQPYLLQYLVPEPLFLVAVEEDRESKVHLGIGGVATVQLRGVHCLLPTLFSIFNSAATPQGSFLAIWDFVWAFVHFVHVGGIRCGQRAEPFLLATNHPRVWPYF